MTVEPEEVEIIGHLFVQRLNELLNKKANKNILDSQAEGTPVSVKIRERLKQAQKRFHANDNILQRHLHGRVFLFLQ